jgi:hypothetical protein
MLYQSASHQSNDTILLGICSVVVNSLNYFSKIVFIDLPITFWFHLFNSDNTTLRIELIWSIHVILQPDWHKSISTGLVGNRYSGIVGGKILYIFSSIQQLIWGHNPESGEGVKRLHYCKGLGAADSCLMFNPELTRSNYKWSNTCTEVAVVNFIWRMELFFCIDKFIQPNAVTVYPFARTMEISCW